MVKVKEWFLPSVFEFLSQSEVEDAFNEVSKGFTDFDLMLGIKHSGCFCDRCGNCCRRCSPIALDPEDINTLGAVLGTGRLTRYVEKKHGRWFFRKTKPCVFLRGNDCVIYDSRPSVCRQFPFVEKDGLLTLGWFSYCKFPVNLLGLKTIALMSNRLLEKREPRLYARMEEQRKVLVKGLESLPNQEDRLLFAGEAIHILESRRRDGVS
jgi:Fe-S-cluster containining protein